MRPTATGVHMRPRILAILFIVAMGCGPGSQFRSQVWDPAAANGYELAFLEFTERGNLRDRGLMHELLATLDETSNAVVLVFVHGWKHNASPQDGNVLSFRGLLENLSRSRTALGERKIIGIYLGWPGLSVSVPIVGEFSFWSRKSVAQEVGKGGVTELLLRLEEALVPQKQDRGNLLLIVGHSFGGAIVLSALHEVLLDRVVNAEEASGQCRRKGRDACEVEAPCVRTRRLANGVIALNPAIEGNQILQLKELISERCFPKDQPTLLHVISTEADAATHTYFPLAQRLGTLFWEEEVLDRVYRGTPTELSEERLDRVAVGNLDRFWTGRMTRGAAGWEYCSFARNHYFECGPSVPKPMRLLPTRTFEPAAFIYTDSAFMGDHNDVFNSSVSAYVAAIAMESLSRTGSSERAKVASPCQLGRFRFGLCLNALDRDFANSFSQDAE